MVSPVTITTMLHCYVYPTLPNNYDTPAVTHAISWLITNGLMIPVLDRKSEIICFEVTEKGRVWVQMLCSAPLPKQAWVDPTK